MYYFCIKLPKNFWRGGTALSPDPPPTFPPPILNFCIRHYFPLKTGMSPKGGKLDLDFDSRFGEIEANGS